MAIEYYIKPGWGYWDITYYPIGGSFKRNGDKPLKVKLSRTFPQHKGCNAEGITETGNTIAFHLEESTV